jgi:hypothetical protein
MLGALMVTPFVAWAVTGAIFFIKPGYGEAYESLRVKTYPLTTMPEREPAPEWREVRMLRTVLGSHLLVRTEDGRQHLNAQTLAPWPMPDPPELKCLIADAIADREARYGQVDHIEGARITTSTGVHINLDWDGLTLNQSGADTRLIDRIYRIHYLQWTGIKTLDRVLGLAGLLCLLALTATGLRLLLRRG